MECAGKGSACVCLCDAAGLLWVFNCLSGFPSWVSVCTGDSGCCFLLLSVSLVLLAAEPRHLPFSWCSFLPVCELTGEFGEQLPWRQNGIRCAGKPFVAAALVDKRSVAAELAWQAPLAGRIALAALWCQQNWLGKPLLLAEVVVRAPGVGRVGWATPWCQQSRLRKPLVAADLARQVLGGSRVGQASPR